MTTAENSVFEPVLANNYGDQFLHSINGDSFLKQNAGEVFKKNIDKSFWDENTYHVVIGTDSGLLIQYLVEQGIADNSCYLFIELPQYIELIRPELPPEWQNVLKFCTPQQWAEQFDRDAITPYLYNSRVKIHRSLSTIEVHNPAYHQARIEIEYAYDDLIFQIRRLFGNSLFIERQITNSVDNMYSSALLNGHFSAKTCVILGGGPSLDLHLEWIKRNRQNLTIIAVARISKKLLSEALIPDIVVSVDPTLLSYDNSKEMLDFPPSTLLINSSHIVPSLLSQWRGKSVFSDALLPWDTKLNPELGASGGPNVVNFGLVVAAAMGFKNILLTGADLCFNLDGASHTQGSFEANKGVDISHQGLWVDTYSGKKAETTAPFAMATKILGVQAQFAKQKNCQVFNLSFDAAIVDNIDFIAINDVQLTDEGQTTQQLIDRLVPSYSQPNHREHLLALEHEFKRVSTDLATIKKLANEAITINQKMCAPQSSKKVQGDNKIKLDKIENKLVNKYGYLSALIKKIAIGEFVKTLDKQANESLSNSEIEQAGRLYYQAYIKGAEQLLQFIVNAGKRLDIRLAAEQPSVDLELINDYWRAQHEFGCLARWADKHAAAPERTSEACNKLLEDNSRSLQLHHQAIEKKYAQQTTSLAKVPYKIRCLFFEMNEQGLALIINQLTKHKKQKQDDAVTASLLAMAQAYQYLFDDKLAAALTAFEQVAEQDLHDVDYKHMASICISLEQYEHAEALLEKLSDLISIHLPLYASILKVNNKQDQAIDAYSRYLEIHNRDTKVWLELAQLFTDISSPESAKMAYEFVLQLEPGNKTALHWLAQ